SAVSHDPSSGVFDNLTEAAARHHAAAGQCFVINVQSCLDAATVKDLGFEGMPEMVREGGGWSASIAPTGQILAGPNRDKETILYAELDLAMSANFKYVSDAAGHYARPDILQLVVNFEPQPIMTSRPARTGTEPEPDQPREARGARADLRELADIESR